MSERQIVNRGANGEVRVGQPGAQGAVDGKATVW